MQLRLDEEFIEIIDHILFYILDYTEGHFKSEKPPRDRKSMAKFIKRSFEGLKKAQDEIVKHLLCIENKIRKADGKEPILFFKEKILQELANSIAFLIFGAEWVHFKPFMHKNMNDGFLVDRNIVSCIEFAKQINEDPMKFAFINDLTSAIGFADITEVSFSEDKGYSIKPIEIKTGKKNAELISIMRGEESLSSLPSEKDLKQIKRMVRELKKMNNFSRYKKSDFLERPENEYSRVALDFRGEPKTYTGQVLKLLENNQDKDYQYISTDFGIIQVCTGFGFAKEMDLKHFVYHSKNESWKDCDYIKAENLLEIIKDKKTKEPFIYANLEIYNAVEGLAYPTLEPLSMLFGREKTVAMLSGKKSVYTYFDYELFSKTLEKKGLKTKLVRMKYLLRNMRFEQKFLGELPKFDNKFLVIFNGSEEMPLTFGFLFKMVYKFLSAEMIAEMISDTDTKIRTKNSSE